MPQAPAETEQVCLRGSKSISGFPLRLGSVTPDAGVRGSGASGQGKRLKPTAVMKVGGGPRPRGPSLRATSAERSGKLSASATRLRLHLLVVLRRVSTRPHLPPGRWLSHSPSLQSHSPRVRRTVNPSLRDQSRRPRDFGAGAPQPAPLRSSTPPQESPHVTGYVSAQGAASTPPRRHRSSWGRVHTAQGARDPPERGPARRPPRKTAAQGRKCARISSWCPPRPDQPAGGGLPCPLPHAPVQAIPSLSYIVQYCRR